jgi:hypothetical protein
MAGSLLLEAICSTKNAISKSKKKQLMCTVTVRMVPHSPTCFKAADSPEDAADMTF